MARGDYWTAERRQAAEAKGHAMPGGRFPIENCTDVHDAVKDLNRIPESERSSVRAHITTQATRLGCPLPESWELHGTS